VGGTDERRQPWKRLGGEERARFLAVLRETGNRRAASAAIGVEPRLMDQRREHDAELDRDWEAAVLEADRRLSAADGPFDLAQDRPFDLAQDGPFDLAQDRPFDFAQDRPFDCPRGGKLNMIRRGKRGRLQLVAAGEGRWTVEAEQRFKEALRACGNVRAAARAAGFSESAIWQRRRLWPAFAEMLEGLLEEAELTLEFRIASMGSNVVLAEEETSGSQGACGAPTGPSFAGKGEDLAAPMPFDADFAMRFLKWREERRRGRGRWAPRAKPPPIEEVTEKIVRRVEAIKRHRRRRAEGEGEGHD
jgi:hypothetical protein